MSTVFLHRVDPARNMRRFYRLDVEVDLFGVWLFTREWGRIGRSGQRRVLSFPTSVEAQQALHCLRQVKERRGYTAVDTLAEC